MHSFIIQISEDKFSNPKFCQMILKKYLDFETKISKLEELEDLIEVKLENKNSIGIETIRNLKPVLNMRPMIWPYKIIWITNADKMTLTAQNAILKILEEPPEHIKIFLLVSNKSTLLETIISRCQNINISQESSQQEIDPQIIADWEMLEKSSISQKLAWTDKNIKDRQQATLWLSNSIRFYNKKNNFIFLKKLDLALSDINRNINYKLALGHMWLNWSID